ncbi:MAG: Mrp/NBP35 family ATP-binding protein [Proteobacteria bacterium]|nr:Mrp/NBP35 family ATP-binding protein [Pseudomonadota bacterium]
MSVNFALPLKNVRRTIAVASGKGGVGKSTTAVNIAFSLQSLGYKVGILDADIYGPSLPILLNLYDKPSLIEREGKKYIVPLNYKGALVLSMGFLVNDDAIIWRGLMVQQAIKQFLYDVAWDINGDLDYLIIDLPPGTGDVQLTLLQKLLLSGGIIVSTPQDLALADAKRGYNMFEKMKVKTLGFLLNMSTFECPHCNETSNIFGTSHLKAFASQENIPYLGEIPLNLDLQQTSDTGTPLSVFDPSHPISLHYLAIAKTLKDTIDAL